MSGPGDHRASGGDLLGQAGGSRLLQDAPGHDVLQLVELQKDAKTAAGHLGKDML